MTEFGPDDGFESALRDLILGRIDLAAAARQFPVGSVAPRVEAVPLADYFDVVDLSTAAGWDELDRHFRGKSDQNFGPWNRCLVALRAQRAVACVIERHYVCLDHRSEHAAFHSSLDAATDSSTTRLHFFRVRVDPSNVLELTNRQHRGYLGYIVCRRYGLPLVGRALIRPPKYIDLVTSIEESVNFFGQRLEIQGVPFMQQDVRYANCAHAAAWSILYSAYRRGTSERRLIADVVAAGSTSGTPMQPFGPLALEPSEVQSIFRSFGLGTTPYTATPYAEFDLPSLPGGALPGLDQIVSDLTAFAEKIARQLGEPRSSSVVRSFERNAVEFACDVYKWARAAYERDPGIATAGSEQEFFEAARLVDRILAAILEPYLRSGFPVYCSTADHALVLCGLSWLPDGQPIFYFNDDQFGPYLASSTLIEASRSNLQWQAYVRDVDTPNIQLHAPRLDRSKPTSAMRKWPDEDRSIRVFVVPAPRRIMLSPTAAEAHVRTLLRTLVSEEGSQAVNSDDLYELRTSIVMGIDYKRTRRDQAGEKPNAVRAFASLHFAEWVVLVEASRAGEPNKVRFELVYDGTSSDQRPLLQFARVGRQVIAVRPGRAEDVQVAEIELAEFAPIMVPKVVGKVRSSRS